MNPYVFFVGCPRSGTTLLRRIANAHPELAVVREQHWLPLWWKRRIGVTSEGLVTPALVEELVAHRRFGALGVAAERVAELVDDDRPKHYARFVTELFDLHGEVVGKRLVGEKTPKYVRYLPTLHTLWPDAKVVHLIRDARDVALSLLDWSRARRNVGRFSTWAEDPMTTSALFWEWNVRLGREASTFLGSDGYCELRYETLVSDPEAECRKLCTFLALPYDDGMLRFHEGRSRSQPGLSPKHAHLGVTAGLRNWREQLAPADVARVDAAAGPLLDELGYARGATSSGADVRRAAQLREAFIDDARSRRLAVPDGWVAVAA